MLLSVSDTYEDFYRQDECLQAQNQGMNESNRVDGVQIQSLESSKIFLRQ